MQPQLVELKSLLAVQAQAATSLMVLEVGPLALAAEPALVGVDQASVAVHQASVDLHLSQSASLSLESRTNLSHRSVLQRHPSHLIHPTLSA